MQHQLLILLTLKKSGFPIINEVPLDGGMATMITWLIGKMMGKKFEISLMIRENNVV